MLRSTPASAPEAPPMPGPVRGGWPWPALLNLLANQAVWFLCILGAATGRAGWGSAAAVALVAWHLRTTERPGREAVLVLAAMLLGGLFDTAWLATGWVQYTSGQVHAGFTPHWMLALWAAFATSMNLSMRWLQSRLIWAAVLGAVGGVLSFRAGEALGAVRIEGGGWAWVVLAAGWALVFPVLCRIAAWAAESSPAAVRIGPQAEGRTP